MPLTVKRAGTWDRAYFIIAIMGCGDGGIACQTVADRPPGIMPSEQACLAARGDALMANSDLDFPTLLAECRPVQPQGIDARPEPAPEGSVAT